MNMRSIEIGNVVNLCHEVGVLKTFRILVAIFTVIKILTPVLIIILSIISLTKAVLDDNTIKKTVSLTIKRIVIGVFIFFIPSLMGSIINYVRTDSKYINLSECIKNSKNIKYYEDLQANNLNKEKLEKENKRKYLLSKYNEIINKYNRDNIYSNPSLDEPATSPSGSTIGSKYSLSSDDLSFLTKVAKCEQGNIEGIKAELSLMANRFELFGKSYSSLRSYVQNSGWFACSKHASSVKIVENELSVAKTVLVLGNRTLALYVDEHDCINCNNSKCSNGNRGDICKLVTNDSTVNSINSIKNHSNYRSGQTILYNLYGSVYTFYSFPCNSCDPFGYTKSAKNKFDSLNRG